VFIEYVVAMNDQETPQPADHPDSAAQTSTAESTGTDRPEWVPEGLDITTPNAARVYDAVLGGYHNFEVDRRFKDQAETAWPGLSLVAYANRAYLGRVVRWLVGQGVRQFLDIGSGIPTLGNVHEVAQSLEPQSRVVYVDIDPVAVSHSTAILAGNPYAHAIMGDLRRPADILYHPDVLEWLDFSEPVAVLMIAVLHFINDPDDPAGCVAQFRDALVAGSYLAISHGVPDPDQGPTQRQEEVRKLYERTPTPFQVRSNEQVLALLSGWDVVDPGLVPVTDWHPDPDGDRLAPVRTMVGVVDRKS
jgi:hypothetical protein